MLIIVQDVHASVWKWPSYGQLLAKLVLMHGIDDSDLCRAAAVVEGCSVGHPFVGETRSQSK
jgi:hypothetical protein